ncbi:hypothetical protein CK203_068564 [Vitis vinifera]|uniref:Uncharacterized protein n=1 Tax=Vitis vinifera TaxID=29760 RepID=A0A438EEB7_VITVI|nr:hypothetical protein CK203_068564 [Vitis vinifera]
MPTLDFCFMGVRFLLKIFIYFEVGSGCSPMVELQSCATLVNASALCAIEQEVQGDGVNAIAEISAELQRERQKNAELMERISMLEAQIQERDGHDYVMFGNHSHVSDDLATYSNIAGGCKLTRE